jgi:hypothetical protein
LVISVLVGCGQAPGTPPGENQEIISTSVVETGVSYVVVSIQTTLTEKVTISCGEASASSSGSTQYSLVVKGLVPDASIGCAVKSGTASAQVSVRTQPVSAVLDSVSILASGNTAHVVAHFKAAMSEVVLGVASSGTCATSVNAAHVGGNRYQAEFSGLSFATNYVICGFASSGNERIALTGAFASGKPAPPVVSSVNIATRGASASASATFNAPASLILSYGPTEEYGKTIELPSAAAHSFEIADLVHGTEYKYRLVARDQYGQESEPHVGAFRTQTACADTAGLEWTEVEMIHREPSPRVTIVLHVDIAATCGSEHIYLNSIPSSSVISADGGTTFRFTYRMPVTSTFKIGAQVLVYDVITGRFERWLTASEVDWRWTGGDMIVHGERKLGRTIANRCGVDAQCVDGDPYLFEVHKQGSGYRLVPVPLP